MAKVPAEGDPLLQPTRTGPVKDVRRIGADDQDVSTGLLPTVCSGVLFVISVILLVMTFPLSLAFIVKVIPEYQRAVIFRLGRLKSGGATGPGMFAVIPCTDSYTAVDLRTRPFDVTPQEILTKDSVTVTVDAVVYFRVSDPLIAINNTVSYEGATRLLAKTTLRNVLGAHSLSEILSEKEAISGQMRLILDDATDLWGVKVERVEIKDVRIPQELRRVMAAEAEASREAKAKVIAAQGELNASRALKEAASVIARSPTALQLRYLQTLNFIGAEKGTSVLFPIPMDLMSGLNIGQGGGLLPPPTD